MKASWFNSFVAILNIFGFILLSINYIKPIFFLCQYDFCQFIQKMAHNAIGLRRFCAAKEQCVALRRTKMCWSEPWERA
jgi:hypothetical protein